MILIVEGPDGAGKTTFARGFGGRYHHEGPPPTDLGPGNLFQYYLDKVIRAATSASFTRATVVFDRLALGELIYGPILRGTNRLGELEYASFVHETSKLGAVHVMCLPPLKTCFANWSLRADRGLELIRQDETFHRTYEAFAGLAHMSDMVFDYTRDGSAREAA